MSRSDERTIPREDDCPAPEDGASAAGERAAAPVDAPLAQVPLAHVPLPHVIVCSSCREPDGSDARPRPGERLAEAARLAAAPGGDVRVSAVECLGNCKRRLSAAVVSPGAWTYVFGDLSDAHGADLVLGARLLAAAPDGIMPWRGRPDCLKRGLVARVPPVSLLTPDEP